MKTVEHRSIPSILTILFTFGLLACGMDTERPGPDEKKEVIQHGTPTTEGSEKESTPAKPLPKPGAGRVKEFFLDYGQKHPETKVLLKTRLGEIEIRLYDETPVHRANFLYNINEELYHKTIFYRVVPGFMIQGGNSDNDKTLENRDQARAYYLPNEHRPELIHKRGAVAMAMSYDDNPMHKSAQYSYYIVIGTPFTDAGLDAVEEEYGITLSQTARQVYKKIGGTPHLDQKHTVFGEVVRGMEVVEAISNEKRDSGDWPVEDVVVEYEAGR